MTTDAVPAVSIVVPCYHAAGFIQDAVGRLLAQQDVAFEVVLVDDGSKDDTAEILTRLDEAHDSVRAILLTENGGVAAAREAGVAAARSEYVWFVDADDEWPADAAAALVLAATTADADIVCAGAQVVAEGRPPRRIGRLPEATELSGGEALHRLLTGDLTGHLWNKLFRRSLLGRICFTPIRQHSDQAMVAQAFVEAQRVAVLHRDVYTYHLRAGSIIRSGTRRAESLRELGEVVAQCVARVDATALKHPDFHYYRARYSVLSRLKDATSGAYAPPERRSLIREIRAEMSLAGVVALARRKDAVRLTLFTIGWASPRAFGLVLDRAGGRV